MMLKKKEDILYWGLAGLILYMPLHYYLCELLLANTSLDNILRDAVILLLAALVFFRKESFSHFLCVLVAVNCVFLTAVGVASAVLNKRMEILNILRTYLVPMLIFFVSRSARLDRERLLRLNLFLTVELAVVAIYGFFQAFFLTDDFLVLLGYPSNGEYLASSSFYISHFFGYQRTVGTFVSPNICGAILAIALCILLFSNQDHAFRWVYIWGVLLMTGLITTFSRSAWLGFAAATGFYLLISGAWRRLSKRTVRWSVLVALTAVAFLIFDWLVLDGLCLRMLMSTVFRTFNGEDPSAGAHLEHLTVPPALTPPSTLPTDTVPSTTLDTLGAVLQFGLNGPMANEFLENATNVESSLYLMVYELGIVGSVLYFSPYVAVVLLTFRHRKDYPYFAPAAICILVLMTYIFLPNVQSFEIPFYCFLFMGLYSNPTVKALYSTGEIRQVE